MLKILLLSLALFTGGDSPSPIMTGHVIGGDNESPTNLPHCVVIEHIVRAGDAAIVSMSDGGVVMLNPAPDTAALVGALAAAPTHTHTIKTGPWTDAHGLPHVVETLIYDNDTPESIAAKEKVHNALVRSMQNLYPPVVPQPRSTGARERHAPDLHALPRPSVALAA